MTAEKHSLKRAKEARSLRGELGLTARLGAPLALGEVGWMSTYIVDALMIGHLPNSPLAISASSLGNSIFYAIAFCIIFLMNGLETLIAQAYGDDQKKECAYLLAQSVWFVVLGTPVVIGVTLGVLALLPYLGTPPAIYAETANYLRVLVWSTTPLLAYMALRRFLQSVDNVLWVTISLLTASFVNWLGDWVFLFGHWGFHPMGMRGSAWSTVIVRLFMMTLLAIGTVLALRRLGERITFSMLRPELCRLRTLFRIGWPSGFESLTELAVTTVTSILCARLGPILLAANQVTLDLNALVYQVSAGLSYATVVRVGQSAGRNNLLQVRLAAKASLVLGLGFMACAATAFAVFSHRWASYYTNSAAVIAAAVPIFWICAMLLLTDTIFVLLAASLTGLGDTRTPMIVSVICNWAIGVPLAYVLAFQAGLTLRGLWIGRAAASFGTALALGYLWRRRMRRAAEVKGVSLAEQFNTGLPICA